MTTKQLIQEYVNDHYKHFGFYPYDVEVDGQVYSYGGYSFVKDAHVRAHFQNAIGTVPITVGFRKFDNV